MSRDNFLKTYREVLEQLYDWAKDTAKLDKYMAKVRGTIAGENNAWHSQGPAVDAAWARIGGTGKPTLKALRGLQA
jgi:hypothetical protein